MTNDSSYSFENMAANLLDAIENPKQLPSITKPQGNKLNKFFYMAQQVLKNELLPKTIFSLDQQLFYIYKEGIWTVIKENEFLNIISKSFIDFDKYALRGKKEVLDNYKVINFIKEIQFNNTKFLNMKNGMLDIYNKKLEPHSHEYYSTNQIEYNYIKEAICPLWKKVLNDIFEGDSKRIELLQEFYGYCLTPENNQKKALLLLGNTDTGKSTILGILEYMLGSNNVSCVELKDFENPQLTPQMVNKLVNIDFDVNKNAHQYESGFRKITSGEKITSNQKFEAAFQFAPICKIVMAANTFPTITDYTSAFYNRLLVVPMNRRFSDKEKIIGLVDSLKEEIPGILNWCIEGLLRFKSRGKFEEYDFVKNAVKQLEDDNNPVNNFLNDHIEFSNGYYLEKGEIFIKYCNWCDANKHKALPHNRFANVLFNKFQKETFKDTQHPDTHKRVWKNLKYVEYKENNNREEIKWKE